MVPDWELVDSLVAEQIRSIQDSIPLGVLYEIKFFSPRLHPVSHVGSTDQS